MPTVVVIIAEAWAGGMAGSQAEVELVAAAVLEEVMSATGGAGTLLKSSRQRLGTEMAESRGQQR